MKSTFFLIPLLSIWAAYWPIALAGDPDMRFEKAMYRGADISEIESILKTGADPDIAFQMRDGYHSVKLNKELVELFIRYGGNPFEMGARGVSTFFSALEKENRDYGFADYLLELQRTFRKPDFHGPSSLDELQQFIKDRKIKTISSLLSQLPQDFKNKYVMMYESKSLQGATDTHPRIIMFGGTGNLIIAFNSDPSQLEAIEFDWHSFKYKFQEFDVNSKTPSAINPKICTSCHLKSGTSPNEMRPNWNPYDFWPGAYGSNDDRLKKEKNGFKGITPWDLRFPRDPGQEEAAFDDFMRQDHSGTPYEHLPRYGYYANKVPSDKNLKAYYSSRPNLMLTRLVYFQNAFRIADIIRNSPQYEKYKFLIQMILKNCSFEWNEVIQLKSSYNRETILESLDPDVRRLLERMNHPNGRSLGGDIKSNKPAEREGQLYLKLVFLDQETGTQFTNDGKAILNWSLLPEIQDIEFVRFDLFESGSSSTLFSQLWFPLTLIDKSLRGLECRELFENLRHEKSESCGK